MAYIDREKALLELQKFSLDTSDSYGVGYSDCLTAVEDVLNDLPTADVVEVKHGYWFDTYKGGSKKGCSVCHCRADLSKQGKEYCLHCGAKMDGKPQKD